MTGEISYRVLGIKMRIARDEHQYENLFKVIEEFLQNECLFNFLNIKIFYDIHMLIFIRKHEFH